MKAWSDPDKTLFRGRIKKIIGISRIFQWNSNGRWFWVQWLVLSFSGVGTVGVGGGWTLWDPEYVTGTLVEMSTAHWKQRRSARHYVLYTTCCVCEVCSWKQWVKLAFFFFFLPIFGRLPVCVPIVLTQLYSEYNIFWQLKPSALLACKVVIFRVQANVESLPPSIVGWWRQGFDILLGLLL